MTCPGQLAVDYFSRLSAPAKELIWMEDAAHLMWGDDPDEFVRVIKRILGNYTASRKPKD